MNRVSFLRQIYRDKTPSLLKRIDFNLMNKLNKIRNEREERLNRIEKLRALKKQEENKENLRTSNFEGETIKTTGTAETKDTGGMTNNDNNNNNYNNNNNNNCKKEFVYRKNLIKLNPSTYHRKTASSNNILLRKTENNISKHLPKNQKNIVNISQNNMKYKPQKITNISNNTSNNTSQYITNISMINNNISQNKTSFNRICNVSNNVSHCSSSCDVFRKIGKVFNQKTSTSYEYPNLKTEKIGIKKEVILSPFPNVSSSSNITNIPKITNIPNKKRQFSAEKFVTLKENHNNENNKLRILYSSGNVNNTKILYNNLNNSLGNRECFSEDIFNPSPITVRDLISPKSIKKSKDSEFINIEDLLILDEKFCDVLSSVSFCNANIQNTCVDFIQFYSSSSMMKIYEECFKNKEIKAIMTTYILTKLYLLIITYHLSFDDNYLKSSYKFLHMLIDISHKIYLLSCKYISSKISNKFKSNIWVKKLDENLNKNLVHVELNDLEYINFISKNINNNITDKDDTGIISEIKYHLQSLDKYIHILLINFPSSSSLKPYFTSVYIDIQKKTIKSQKMISFFKEKVLKIINENASFIGFLPPNFGKDNNYFKNFPKNTGNYLPKKGNDGKKFTLVLDLDETLISFSITNKREGKGTIKFRPHIDEFLDTVKNYYELICFTSATKDYADPIENEIELNNSYFAYRLYREHTVLFENEFVKDISKLGRDIDKIIIVDNIPQNFRFQKENGIWIKPFWGEDEDDMALYYLKDILERIALGYDDVREGIKDLKDEILIKVSSNYSKE